MSGAATVERLLAERARERAAGPAHLRPAGTDTVVAEPGLVIAAAAAPSGTDASERALALRADELVERLLQQRRRERETAAAARAGPAAGTADGEPVLRSPAGVATGDAARRRGADELRAASGTQRAECAAPSGALEARDRLIAQLLAERAEQRARAASLQGGVSAAARAHAEPGICASSQQQARSTAGWRARSPERAAEGATAAHGTDAGRGASSARASPLASPRARARSASPAAARARRALGGQRRAGRSVSPPRSARRAARDEAAREAAWLAAGAVVDGARPATPAAPYGSSGGGIGSGGGGGGRGAAQLAPPSHVERGLEDSYVRAALADLLGSRAADAPRALAAGGGGAGSGAGRAEARATPAGRPWAVPSAFPAAHGCAQGQPRPSGAAQPARGPLSRGNSPRRERRAPGAAARAARQDGVGAEDGSEPGARLRSLSAPRPPFGAARPPARARAASAAAAEAAEGGVPSFRPSLSERTRLLAERHAQRQARRAQQAQAQAETQGAARGGRADNWRGGSCVPAAFSAEGGSWVARLAEDRAAVYAQREAARREAEAQQQRQQPPRQPRAPLSDGARSRATSPAGGAAADGAGRADEDAGARLHREAAERREARLALQRAAALSAARAARAARHPEINATSQTIVAGRHVPIEQRADLVVRQREARVHALRLALAEKDAAVCTFRPASARSLPGPQRALLGSGSGGGFGGGAEEAGGGGDVAERLLSRGSAQLERQLLRQRAHEQRLAQACPFRPEANTTSRRILESSDAFGARSFAERQALYAEQRERRLGEVEAALHAAQGAAFTPRLDPNSVAINAAAAAEAGADELADAAAAFRALPVDQRLAVADAERRRAAQEARRAAWYSQYTHTPAVNPVSAALDAQLARGGGGSAEARAEQLYRNARALASRTEASQLAEEEFQARHPFRPKVLHKSVRMARLAGVGERFTADAAQAGALTQAIDAERRRRDARTEALRREREAAELADCTFKPERLDETRAWAREAMEAPVVVAGLDRHLELREAARRLQQEQRKREEHAFLLDIGDRLADHARTIATQPFTVPLPFQLATDERGREDARLERLREELRLRLERECTFQPNAHHQQPLVAA